MAKKNFNLDEVIENATKILTALGMLVDAGNAIVNNLKAYRDATTKVIDVAEPKQIEAKEEPKTEKVAKATEEKTEPTYTKEQVRAALSAKSNADNGAHRAEVKALVKKYANGGSLTDVSEDDYPALLSELEEI